jgi:hypothetical protein
VLLLVAPLLSAPALAAEVRQLGQSGEGVQLGTEAFSMVVYPTGTIREIKVGDTVLLPFVSLYTNPYSPTTDKSLRCCQAETPGLGKRECKLDLASREGAMTATIVRDCSHPEAYNDEPLWRLRETIEVLPTGKFTVTYDCQFLRIVRWYCFEAVFAAAMEEVEGRDYEAYLPGETVTGKIPQDLADRKVNGELRDFVAQSSKGPLRFSFTGRSHASVDNWTTYLAVIVMAPSLPHGEMFTYRGVRDVFSVAVQLPVQP